jgi:hypothetical protein
VALMSFGNYVGTRFAYYAIMAPICVISALVLAMDPSNPRIAVMSIAMFIPVLKEWRAKLTGTPLSSSLSWNRLWTDFRNLFGIVWALRIAERVNAQAAKEGWGVRLGMRGFIDARSGERVEPPQEDPQIDHTLRWLLRRFVDDEWIDSRLGKATEEAGDPQKRLRDESPFD